jgi:hypothetical protein
MAKILGPQTTPTNGKQKATELKPPPKVSLKFHEYMANLSV